MGSEQGTNGGDPLGVGSIRNIPDFESSEFSRFLVSQEIVFSIVVIGHNLYGPALRSLKARDMFYDPRLAGVGDINDRCSIRLDLAGQGVRLSSLWWPT